MSVAIGKVLLGVIVAVVIILGLLLTVSGSPATPVVIMTVGEDWVELEGVRYGADAGAALQQHYRGLALPERLQLEGSILVINVRAAEVAADAKAVGVKDVHYLTLHRVRRSDE